MPPADEAATAAAASAAAPSPEPAPAPATSAAPPTPTAPSPHTAAGVDVGFATVWSAPGVSPADYESRCPDMRFAEVRGSWTGARARRRVPAAGHCLPSSHYTHRQPTQTFPQVIRRSHAGKAVHIAVLTDPDTVLTGLDGALEVFRSPRIERSRVGRNSYANYAQMIAQIDYLRHLEAVTLGATPPVVFLDTDMLVRGGGWGEGV